MWSRKQFEFGRPGIHVTFDQIEGAEKSLTETQFQFLVKEIRNAIGSGKGRTGF
jgi:hypothetical protein